MRKNLVNELLVFDTGDDLCGTTAMSTGFYIYVEYPFQPLGPGHGRPSFFWCFVLSNSFSSAFAPPARSHQNPVLAVWMMRHSDEYTVKSCEVDLRLWYKRGQLCDEVQGIEYYMGRAGPKAFAALMGPAFTVGCLELAALAHPALAALVHPCTS